MTFTASLRTNPFHGSYGCNGLNHRDVGLAGFCDDCGAAVLQAAKGQLTDPGRNSKGNQVFQCWLTHHCDPRLIETRALRDAETLISGRFPKGVEVEVFKGRKVPVGTVGIVKWVGEGFHPGTERLGLKVEGQTKLVYVDGGNCQASAEVREAALATVQADKTMREERAARHEALEAELVALHEEMTTGVRELLQAGKTAEAEALMMDDGKDARRREINEELAQIREERGY